jgi:type VI secretion system secreted protein Hcp
MAQIDYFLKLDGIPGESTDAKHKGEIEVLSFSWGETNSGGAGAGGGGGAGKVSVQDFHFAMRLNKASPRLSLACAQGQHLKDAVMTGRKAGRGQQEFLFYKFTDVLISSYQTGASAQDPEGQLDQVSFNFAKIETEYRPQKPDGSLDTPIKVGWDVKNNKKI